MYIYWTNNHIITIIIIIIITFIIRTANEQLVLSKKRLFPATYKP